MGKIARHEPLQRLDS